MNTGGCSRSGNTCRSRSPRIEGARLRVRPPTRGADGGRRGPATRGEARARRGVAPHRPGRLAGHSPCSARVISKRSPSQPFYRRGDHADAGYWPSHACRGRRVRLLLGRTADRGMTVVPRSTSRRTHYRTLLGRSSPRHQFSARLTYRTLGPQPPFALVHSLAGLPCSAGKQHRPDGYAVYPCTGAWERHRSGSSCFAARMRAVVAASSDTADL